MCGSCQNTKEVAHTHTKVCQNRTNNWNMNKQLLQCLLLFFIQFLQLEVIVTDMLSQLIGSILHFFDQIPQIPWFSKHRGQFKDPTNKWKVSPSFPSSTFERIRKHFWFNPNWFFLSLNQKTGHFFPRHRTCSFVLNMKSFNSCGCPLRRAKTPRSRSDIPDQTLETNFQVAWEDAKWSFDFQVDFW